MDDIIFQKKLEFYKNRAAQKGGTEKGQAMRLNYYRFPAKSDPMDRFNEGFAVILKTGSEIYPESIPDDK